MKGNTNISLIHFFDSKIMIIKKLRHIILQKQKKLIKKKIENNNTDIELQEILLIKNSNNN